MEKMKQIKIINNEWIKTENEYWIHKNNILAFYVSASNAVVVAVKNEDFRGIGRHVLMECKSEKEASQLLEHTLRSL